MLKINIVLNTIYLLIYEKYVDLSDCPNNVMLYCRVECNVKFTIEGIKGDLIYIKNKRHNFIVSFRSTAYYFYKTTNKYC